MLICSLFHPVDRPAKIHSRRTGAVQGARLTSYELDKAGIDVTLICDNMASMVMKNGWVQACFVGCDRVAANGDTANKIGTSGVAILAKYYNIPFYACLLINHFLFSPPRVFFFFFQIA